MEQTTKYSSSGWRSNSFWLLLLLVFGFGFAQDKPDSDVRNQTLTSRHSLMVLQSYQNNSLQKLGDFYHYLNLLSAANDKNLQQQLKEAIYTLFDDKNILVEDFTTDKKDKIPLSYLLDNIASKKLNFSIKNENVSREFYRDFWYDSYTLEIAENGETKSRQIKQAVHLKPEDKAFGSNVKSVLQVSLGAIE